MKKLLLLLISLILVVLIGKAYLAQPEIEEVVGFDSENSNSPSMGVGRSDHDKATQLVSEAGSDKASDKPPEDLHSRSDVLHEQLSLDQILNRLESDKEHVLAAEDIAHMLGVTSCASAFPMRGAEIDSSIETQSANELIRLEQDLSLLEQCKGINKPEMELALEILEKAAMRGNVKAGEAYFGAGLAVLGLPENQFQVEKLVRFRDNAVKFLESAANAGSDDALFHLYGLYSDGSLVRKDASRAHLYLKRYVDRSKTSNPAFQQLLAKAEAEMKDEHQQRIENK